MRQPKLARPTVELFSDGEILDVNTQRRFPPPWSVEELQACFVVKDSAGQKLVIQI